MNEGRPGNIDAAGRLGGDKQLRLAIEFARDGKALLVAAGEAAGWIAQARRNAPRGASSARSRLDGNGAKRSRPKREKAGSRSRPAMKLSRIEAVRQSPSSPRSALK